MNSFCSYNEVLDYLSKTSQQQNFSQTTKIKYEGQPGSESETKATNPEMLITH